MTRSCPPLSFRISSAAVAGTALAFVLHSAPVQAQVLYATASYTGNAPGSTAAAITTFDSLDASTSGYGCATVTTLDGVNNESQFTGGSGSNIAYHQAAVFVVASSQVGLWSFRWSGDFGLGGTLLLDGVELQSRWTPMWWGGDFTDPSQYLTGSANLMAGTHIVELFGFEDCCDGAGNAQFLPQMSTDWLDISAANLALVPTVCGSPALLLTGSASPSPVPSGSHLTFALFYESTGQFAAAGAALSTSIPAGTTFVSATGGGVFSNGAVNWTLGPLGVGVSGTVTFTVQVAATLADGTAISDLASLTATGATTATATTNVATTSSPDGGTSDAAVDGTGTGGSGTGSGGGGAATGSAGADGGSATGNGGAGGTSTDGGATGIGGAGGNKGAAGAAPGGNAGKAGAAGGSNASSGCGCAVGNAASPTGLLGIGAVVGLLLVSRRKRRR